MPVEDPATSHAETKEGQRQGAAKTILELDMEEDEEDEDEKEEEEELRLEGEAEEDEYEEEEVFFGHVADVI